MSEFDSIEQIANNIKLKLDSSSDQKKLVVLYAFNSTGKTRLSTAFDELNEDKVLCYNAFVEDLFIWDNESYVLKFDSNSWLAKLINEEGLENRIIDNFKNILGTKIEPSFNVKIGEVAFNIPTGDDDSQRNIKISKGEESTFIWIIFFTLLEALVEISEVSPDDRSTKAFDSFDYIFIDDPVSSMDDTRLIAMAVKLVSLIKSNSDRLRFIVTTHHALFYNVFFNSCTKREGYKNCFHVLSRNEAKLRLDIQGDSPFSYHLVIKDEIQKSINAESIKKYHFNLFRSLLEKTANFLGYKNWADCIVEENKSEFLRLINLYSHDRLSDLEYKELSKQDRGLFAAVFNDFVKEYKWS